MGYLSNGGKCSVRRQICTSNTGVKRETYHIIVQCGKGRLKAEMLRVKLEQFIRAQKANVTG